MARARWREKAEQLQLISNVQEQFLANMSHELRTPLNRCSSSPASGRQQESNLFREAGGVCQDHLRSGGDLLSR